jgi:hypothetical protein
LDRISGLVPLSDRTGVVPPLRMMSDVACGVSMRPLM